MHVYTYEYVLCFLFYLILEMNWVEAEADIEMDDEGDAAKRSALIGRVKFPCEVPRSCPRTTRQTDFCLFSCKILLPSLDYWLILSAWQEEGYNGN